MSRGRGRWLVILAGVHLLYGCVKYAQSLADVGRDGVVNSVDGHSDRETAFWFLVTGLLIGLVGFLAMWAEQQIGRIPVFLGWFLMGLGAFGVVLMPLSPFWVVIAIGAVLLRAPGDETVERARPTPLETRHGGRVGRPS